MKKYKIFTTKLGLASLPADIRNALLVLLQRRAGFGRVRYLMVARVAHNTPDIAVNDACVWRCNNMSFHDHRVWGPTLMVTYVTGKRRCFRRTTKAWQALVAAMDTSKSVDPCVKKYRLRQLVRS